MNIRQEKILQSAAWILFLAFLALPVPCFSQSVYFWTGVDGTLHFSDRPPSGAQPNVISSPPPVLNNIVSRNQSIQEKRVSPGELPKSGQGETSDQGTTEEQTRTSTSQDQESANQNEPEPPPPTRARRLAESKMKKTEAIQKRFTRTREPQNSETILKDSESTSPASAEKTPQQPSVPLPSSEPKEKTDFDWNDL